MKKKIKIEYNSFSMYFIRTLFGLCVTDEE